MAGNCPTIPLCDIHHDDVAIALCKYHKEFLCLSCILEKPKSPECSISEVRKITGDQDYALYECLLVRQMSMKKKRLIEEHKNTVETLKISLNQQIIELHGKLVTRLNEMKEYCLKTVATQAEAIQATDESIQKQIHVIDNAITETLEKLSAESIDDLSNIQTKVNELKTNMLEDVPDMNSVPEGYFQPENCIKDFIQHSGCSIGKVYLIDSGYCTEFDEIKADKSIHDLKNMTLLHLPHSKQGNRDSVTIINASKHSDRYEEPEYISSDEIVFDSEKTDKQLVTNTDNQTSAGVNAAYKSKKRSGLFGGLLSRKKSEQS